MCDIVHRTCIRIPTLSILYETVEVFNEHNTDACLSQSETIDRSYIHLIYWGSSRNYERATLNDVMSDVNWTILPKERWALVGRYGAGNSTLLRAITGTGGELVSISEGGISIAKKARMGYLEQKGVSGSVMTVRQEVSSRMDRLTAATAALDKAETAVSAGDTSDEMLIELEEASVEFEAAGGYTVEQKISNVLKGLGFIEEDYDRCDQSILNFKVMHGWNC